MWKAGNSRGRARSTGPAWGQSHRKIQTCALVGLDGPIGGTQRKCFRNSRTIPTGYVASSFAVQIATRQKIVKVIHGIFGRSIGSKKKESIISAKLYFRVWSNPFQSPILGLSLRTSESRSRRSRSPQTPSLNSVLWIPWVGTYDAPQLC